MPNHRFTGRPSVDKPWLKYYSDDAIHAELPDCTMFDYLWECNKDNLDDIAINYFDRKIAYRKLFENIEKTTQAFASIGVNHGDSVLIVSVTLPEVIYSIYALNRLGAIANMVDPRTSVEGIQHYAKESNAKYMLAIDALGSKSEEIVIDTDISKIVLLSPADSLSPLKRFAYQIKERPYKTTDSRFYTWKSFQDIKSAITIPKREYSRDDCAVIVHTGGTTGTPKGVMLSDYNLNSTVIQVALSGFDIHRKDKWLNIMPPFIAYGIGNGMHFPLCIGMELILIPMFDPKKYDALLLKYKPAHMAGVPSHYDSVIHSGKLTNLDMSFLLSPVVGGDGMDTTYEQQVNGFLNSRNCPTNLIKGYGMTEICAAVCAASRMEYNKLGSAGIPFSHSVVSIFDSETGEEMTQVIDGASCVHECAVVCLPHPLLKSIPIAFVVLDQNNTEETISEVKACCEERLPEHSWPKAIYSIERIPKTSVGKPDYKKLEELAEELYSK